MHYINKFCCFHGVTSMTYGKEWINSIQNSADENSLQNKSFSGEYLEAFVGENPVIHEEMDTSPEATDFEYHFVRAIVDLVDIMPIDSPMDEEIFNINNNIRERLEAVLSSLDQKKDPEATTETSMEDELQQALNTNIEELNLHDDAGSEETDEVFINELALSNAIEINETGKSEWFDSLSYEQLYSDTVVYDNDDFDTTEPDENYNNISTLFNELTDEEKEILFSRLSPDAGLDERMDVLRGLTIEVDVLDTDSAEYFDSTEPDVDYNDISNIFNELTDEEKAILFSRLPPDAGQEECMNLLRVLTSKIVLEINLKNIDQQNTKKLLQFFESQAQLNIKVWKKDGIYTFADGTKFTFKNDIFQRERKEGHDGVRYEVISNKTPLGEGGFGKVIEIKRTLALDQDKEEIRLKKQGKNGRRRAVKIQVHNDTNSSTDLQKRFEFSKRATHLAIKQPTLVDANLPSETSYTTMARLPGRELFDIINEDDNGTRLLSTDERIELTKALLRALKSQVCERGLIHRDIKPENIMVDLGSQIVANIIDYDSSTDKPDGDIQGTPGYYAPEITSDPMSTSDKSDVYSMARVIALIWRVDFGTYDEPYNPDLLTPEDMLVGIFSDINDLREEEKQCIETLLLGMLKHNLTERLSIDEGVTVFSFFDREAMLDETDPNDPEINEISNIVASAVRDKKEAHERFVTTLNTFALKIIDLMIKADNNEHYKPAAEKSRALLNSLLLVGTDFFVNKTLSPEQFKQKCDTAIDKARPELAKHRGFSEVFADILFIAVSVCSLGTANIVSKLATGSYRFFTPRKTHSEEQLDALVTNLYASNLVAV